MDLTCLNKEQQEAVLYNTGHLLILAGAGSGKTRVLTHKVAYLIAELGVKPENILAITFTNKAAKEMKTRINNLIGIKSNAIQVSTFHALGYKIIRENYKLLGLQSNFTIWDDNDSFTSIKRIIRDMNLDQDYYQPKRIKQQIGEAKNKLLDPVLYGRSVNGDWGEIVVKIYKRYQVELKKNNAVDFADLLMLPIVLFRANKTVLKYYQEHYNYIFIDEYQDTNQAQYLLTKLIGGTKNRICVVGDGDQSIYSWRGADYNNILNFEKDYKGAKVIILEKNYRSTGNILGAANAVISNNKFRKPKRLIANNEIGTKIKYYRGANEKEEAFYVATEIKRLKQEGVSATEIAVLYRTNAQSQTLENCFLAHNISYQVVGAFAFYNRKEIKDLVAYLKVIYNEKDDISLLRCINTPRRGIGTQSINDLIKTAAVKNCSIYEVIVAGKPLVFKQTIEYLKAIARTKSLTTLVDHVLTKTGLESNLKKEGTVAALARLDNLYEFRSVTKEFEEREAHPSLELFLREVSLVSNSDEQQENDDRVSLMTGHAAKGLEFTVVFIVGLEEGLLPHYSAQDDPREREEERRLFYVAMTRAKEQLYLVNAQIRMMFGIRKVNPESSFLQEIEPAYLEYINKEDNIKTMPKLQEDRYYEMVNYKVGDKVIHQKFGIGIVQKIKADLITIAFSSLNETKTFREKHKSLRKINNNN